MNEITETLLDAKGLSCPLPILRAKRVLRDIPHGGLLTVLATDPGSVRDFQAFCKQTGHKLLEWDEDRDGIFRYKIEKAG